MISALRKMMWCPYNRFLLVEGRASWQLIKNRPAMQETSIRFLGWEDPLEMVIAAIKLKDAYSLEGKL